jgi:hypothetical protein
MLKIYGHKIYSPLNKLQEWKQSLEIIHEGIILGFIDREKTSKTEIVRTRNIRGAVMDGECLEWLLQSR